MTLVHIVLFEFKPTTESDVIQDVCQSSESCGVAMAGSLMNYVLMDFGIDRSAEEC